MQYQRILAACVTAISLAMMSTTFSSPIMPFYQQQVYASHLQCPPGYTAPHVDGEPVGGCIPDEFIQQRCDQGAPYDECVPEEPEVCPPGTTGTPPDCEPIPPEEICGNGIDDDRDGQVDENCPPPPPEECPAGTTGTPPDCEPVEPPPQPLNEKYPNQGRCIAAGENKDACKAAFKADKPNK